MITLNLTKQYLNIHPTNTTEDELIQLLIDAAEVQASKLIGQDGMIDSKLIDLALLKDIATNYMHRENYLDAENGGLILSNGTISILNQYRKVVIY
ncbi:head-tail connector protein [Pedobacter nyackensis]|uniref:head-tail connector protein n=1 Tax=Pedobacter nyackensis TaxID=475255 RepID=UPI00292F5695|nr:head-tail connector protein [Pedobacter nyackensis]